VHVVRELLDAGAEIETRNLAGRTPLHVACMSASLDVIAALLAAGADSRVRDREMRRPADMCALPQVYEVLSQQRPPEHCVSGGPTPFGYGDGDAHVLVNRVRATRWMQPDVVDHNYIDDDDNDDDYDNEHDYEYDDDDDDDDDHDDVVQPVLSSWCACTQACTL
jgi:ankyrin repeat protein